jgi:hypothetical protein
MSLRYQAAILSDSFNGLLAPDAPTITTLAPITSTSLSVSFTAPSNTGGAAITSYSTYAINTATGVRSSVVTGTTSPLTITGLTNGVTYAVSVIANNIYGDSLANPINLLLLVGQQAYTTPGTYSWTAPAGVTSVSVVCVGAGGSGEANPGAIVYGGGGGGLAYLNNIPVVPGNSYTVVVGNYQIYGDGESSSFNGATIVATGGKSGIFGSGTSAGGTFSGAGVLGGTGGQGGRGGNGGGGGAAGYTGNGGAGAATFSNSGSNGAGGGAGGGGSSVSGTTSYTGGGGGVGILGQGANGTGGAGGGTFPPSSGTGGSGGTAGGLIPGEEFRGGLYGGGSGSYTNALVGGNTGAVRIIWGVNITRAFPSTNTGDL